MASEFGNIADVITVTCGFTVAFGKAAYRKFKGIQPSFTPGKLSVDVLNGALIVPFALMIMSIFSPQLFLASNPVIIVLAGAIGLFYVIGELWRLD